MAADGPILYYDGACGLCHVFVRFLIERDPDPRLRFAPIQGETAAQRLPSLPEDPDAWSLILEDRAGVHESSTAVLRAVGHVGGAWGLVRIFLYVPAFIREAVYRWIAVRRYGWFGEMDHCPLPAPDQEQRFLP